MEQERILGDTPSSASAQSHPTTTTTSVTPPSPAAHGDVDPLSMMQSTLDENDTDEGGGDQQQDYELPENWQALDAAWDGDNDRNSFQGTTRSMQPPELTPIDGSATPRSVSETASPAQYQSQETLDQIDEHRLNHHQQQQQLQIQQQPREINQHRYQQDQLNQENHQQRIDSFRYQQEEQQQQQQQPRQQYQQEQLPPQPVIRAQHEIISQRQQPSSSTQHYSQDRKLSTDVTPDAAAAVAPVSTASSTERVPQHKRPWQHPQPAVMHYPQQQTQPLSRALYRALANKQQPYAAQLPPTQQKLLQESRGGGVIELLSDEDEENVSTPAVAASVHSSAGAAAAAATTVDTQQPALKRPRTQEELALAAARLPVASLTSPVRYIPLPQDFVPTWNQPLPRPSRRRAFELSLLNVKEFTITGLAPSYDRPPTSLTGLRKIIRQLSRDHGKAAFDEGRWRIPLGAYSSLVAYLRSDPLCAVEGIPENQLKIASLGKAILEKGYPTAQALVTKGVPKGLATALAPFQRGGVNFVLEKDGRALIADDMGLGKTIQAIASMAVYHQEWPLLVLTPSSARYHWENEFQQWLGKHSRINQPHAGSARVDLGDGGEEEENEDISWDEVDCSNCMQLLDNEQIYVLSASKDDVIPSARTRVVICSYGLAPALVDSGKIFPGLFPSAIVDESHMLKNMKSKRTSKLVPILNATSRCVLLSGTPALARPAELWPQLKILGTERHGWWDDESVFVQKYVKRSSAVRRAELHTMLTGTVMIRRLKADILKSLPKKMREKAVVDVVSPGQRKELTECMIQLREGKGVLGKLAREHAVPQVEQNELGQGPAASTLQLDEASTQKLDEAKEQLKQEFARRLGEGRQQIQYTLMATTPNQLHETEKQNLMLQMDQNLQRQLNIWYQERVHELQEEFIESQELSRKSVLNRMYSLTARAKIPLISDMIKRWLADPTKGKLCVFAHHIFVHDELISGVGLTNTEGSDKRYIRIDGSTSPKERQAQIKAFQNDPSIRIAVLGITAAGVAVTLTASSTVWFAELFWTPALMIQAEDRCHRIGQNSRVKCLYFVAVGSLDELLWKLLEKKFADLGEFVEGEEKMKMVVHKTFHGTKDLHTIFSRLEEDDSEDEGLFAAENSEESKDLLDLERDLEGDIEMLVKEEMTMLLPDGDDDEGNADSKPSASANPSQHAKGSTEEDAILLSDDDDGEEDKKPAPENKDSGSLPFVDLRKPFEGARAYSITFNGRTFGIQLALYVDRAVVGVCLTERPKPEVGDILIGINGQAFPQIANLDAITNTLKTAMAQGPVELTFLEYGPMNEMVQKRTVSIRRSVEAEKERLMLAKAMAQANNGNGNADRGGVIDLLDDD